SRMRGSGPGQNSATRRRATSGTARARPSMVRTSGTRTGGGMSRPLPFASRTSATAAASKASAPIPYTVSVGMTTTSPRRTASTVRSMLGPRSSPVASTTGLMASTIRASRSGDAARRGDGPGATGEVAVVGDVGPGAGRGERGGQALPLLVGVLHDEPAAGAQQPASGGGDGQRDAQSVRAAPEERD